MRLTPPPPAPPHKGEGRSAPLPIEVRGLRKVFRQATSGQSVVAIDRLDLRLPLQRIAEAIAACAVFGVVYFGVAFALGVPEVRATLSRFVRR